MLKHFCRTAGLLVTASILPTLSGGITRRPQRPFNILL